MPLISLIFIDLSLAKDLAKGEIKNLSISNFSDVTGNRGTTITSFTDNSTITVDKQITSNLEAGYNVTNDSSVVLSINNIFDNDYERPHGYNQDGRNLSLAYKLKF